jgi:hypothetical protein
MVSQEGLISMELVCSKWLKGTSKGGYVRPHISSLEVLNGFQLNLVLGIYTVSCLVYFSHKLVYSTKLIDDLG